MRVENSIKNAKAGVVFQLTTLLLNFVNRFVLIRFLGSEYLGLAGLFSSILGMLALTELGMGSAIVYNLYKPIHDNDQKKIAALVNFYKKVYSTLALLIFGMGMALMPFLHIFIGDIHELPFSLSYIRFVYFLILIEAACSYLLIYRTTLLTVSQRERVITNVNTVSSIVLSIARILLLCFTKNYILYLAAGILFRISANYISSRYAIRYFPFLKEKEIKKIRISPEDRKNIVSNATNLSIHSFSAYVVNGTDSLIISTFIGIGELGRYSNYSLIFSTIRSFISTIVSSIQAPLGDLVASGDKARVAEVMDYLTHALFLVASFCAISLAALASPFIRILFGEDYVMGIDIVIVCSIHIYLWTITRPIWKLSMVTGLFKDDRKNAVIEAVSNAIISVVAVQYWGIAGTIFGTICSYVIALFYKSRLQHKLYLQKSAGGYLIKLVKYSALFVCELILVLCVVGFLESVIENLYLHFVASCLGCLLIPNVINFLCYWKTKENGYFMNLLKKMLSGLRRKS